MKSAYIITTHNPDEGLVSYVESLLSECVSQILIVNEASDDMYQPIYDMLAMYPGCTVLSYEDLEGEDAFARALAWCDIFLRGHSLANLPGTKRARAFLFPMEALFERYVAKSLRKAAPSDIRVVTQAKDIWLRSSAPIDSLVIRPDILLRRESDGAILAVMDTKWKLLGTSLQHSGVSQADFYQLAAYQRHHGAGEAVLVYPWHFELGELSDTPPLYAHETDSPRIRIAFFDVASPEVAAKSLLATAI